jgi:hypothetical protein
MKVTKSIITSSTFNAPHYATDSSWQREDRGSICRNGGPIAIIGKTHLSGLPSTFDLPFIQLPSYALNRPISARYWAPPSFLVSAMILQRRLLRRLR